MAAPIVGHMDPWFTEMMDDVQELLRQAFQTDEPHHFSDLRVRFRRD